MANPRRNPITPNNRAQQPTIPPNTSPENIPSTSALRDAVELLVQDIHRRRSLGMSLVNPLVTSGQPQESRLGEPTRIPTTHTTRNRPPRRALLTRAELDRLLEESPDYRWDERTRSWALQSTAAFSLLSGESVRTGSDTHYSSTSEVSEESGESGFSDTPLEYYSEDDAGIEAAKRRKRDILKQIFHRAMRKIGPREKKPKNTKR